MSDNFRRKAARETTRSLRPADRRVTRHAWRDASDGFRFGITIEPRPGAMRTAWFASEADRDREFEFWFWRGVYALATTTIR